VVFVFVNDNINDITNILTITDSLASHLTYTQQIHDRVSGGFCDQRFYTAPVTTGSSMTITVDASNGHTITIHRYLVMAYAFTGYDTTTPVAGVGSFMLPGNSTTGQGLSYYLDKYPQRLQDYTLCFGELDAGFTWTPSNRFTVLDTDTGGTDGFMQGRTYSTSGLIEFGAASGAADGGSVAIAIRAADPGGAYDPSFPPPTATRAKSVKRLVSGRH
jgi:hypothetical protein